MKNLNKNRRVVILFLVLASILCHIFMDVAPVFAIRAYQLLSNPYITVQREGFVKQLLYPFWEYYDTSLYISGEYLKTTGGKKASDFFPDYESLQNYEDIEFGVAGNDSLIAPYGLVQYKKAFMLYLSYNEEQEDAYYTQKAAALDNCEYSTAFETSETDLCWQYNFITSEQSKLPLYMTMVFNKDSTRELVYVFFYRVKYRDFYYAEERITSWYEFPFLDRFYRSEELH